MTEQEQKEFLLKSWIENPIARHYSFSEKKLWSKQEEILWSVRKYKRTVVKSANTIGKSFIAADIVMDWLTTKHPSKVVTTAPTFEQVQNILWKEIRQYCFNSKVPIGVEPLQTELKFNDEWFAIGLSTDRPVNFQGKHSPNLLVLVDEASGIDAEIWDMIEALHPKAILAIGNPIDATGKFFECFSSDLWHKITISAIECVEWQDKHGAIPGLVTREWINDMAQMHGTKSPWYRVHVLGEFPEEAENALIKREWIDRARKGLDMDGMPLEPEDEFTAARIISWDVASKHGENENVLGYRYGHTVPTVQGYRQQTATFMREQIQSLYNKKEAQCVVVDADGIGEPMAEILAEAHVPSIEFHGGYAQKAVDHGKFKNLRSQFYWIIAKKFEKGLYNLKHLPNDQFEILRSQLCGIAVKAPDAIGRFQIETKEDMQARGIKSPDYADAFVYLEYGFWARKFSDLRPMSYGRL